MRCPCILLAAVLAPLRAAQSPHSTAWPSYAVIVGPVAGDLERATASSREPLARCHATLTAPQRARLRGVRRALLPLAQGNAVLGLRFDPSVPELEVYRACLEATARSWSIGRPETGLYAVIELTGAELRLLLGTRETAR